MNTNPNTPRRIIDSDIVDVAHITINHPTDKKSSATSVTSIS
jgi:hypothetical protein